jgi:AAA domain, putative AbiEii toxin, Type IV TA system
MDLVSAGLFGYQRFEDDSGDMDLTGSPVAIVGPNEAGKTSFLEALVHLNDVGDFDPRNRTRGYAEDTCVRARFALDEDDRAAIAEVGGVGSPVLLHIFKRTGSAALRYRLDPPLERDLQPRERAHDATVRVRQSKWLREREDDETKAWLDGLIKILEVDAPNLSDEQLSTMAEVAAHLRAAEDVSPAALKLTDQLEKLQEAESHTHPHTLAGEILLRRRPRFLKFDVEWLQLESEFTFPRGPSEAMSALFELIDFDLGQLHAAVASEDRTTVAELIGVVNARFDELFEGRWSQSNVRVHIHVDQRVVHVFVRTAAGKLIPMADRSAGLRQFIALLAFVEHERRESERVILLIDEAETHLHYDAQADLVNVLTRQTVADKIIYTTHSAGCLPLDLGTGIRVIEPIGPEDTLPEDWERSRIRNAFWTTGPGFSPLLLAMGAGSFVFAAMRRAVVGEGPTEVILLPTLLREATGLANLDFQIAPGVSSVSPSAVRELDAAAARLAYVVDGDESGLAHRQKLIDNGIEDTRIVVLRDATGGQLAIEDLVEPELYLQAVNRVLERYGRVPVPADRVGDSGRKAAVTNWCREQNSENPSEREVAQQILEISSERRRRGEGVRLLDNGRRELVVALHETLRALLND